jgi:hypothetical protein
LLCHLLHWSLLQASLPLLLQVLTLSGLEANPEPKQQLVLER